MGYFDRWSVVRGESLELKVSTPAPEFQVEIVRFDHYFCDPEPSRDDIVESSASGRFPGREQQIAIGSYATVPLLDDVPLDAGFTVHCWLHLAIAQHARGQAIVARWDSEHSRGFRLMIDPAGHLVGSIEDGASAVIVQSASPLFTDRWYFVAFRVDPAAGTMTLDVDACKRRWLSGSRERSRAILGERPAVSSGTFLLGAGELADRDSGLPAPAMCLNGKIDRPAIWNRALSDGELDLLASGVSNTAPDQGLLARWDLSQAVASRQLVDISGNERHGWTVNRPMRAVVGANWDGTAVSFDQNPAHYGAIAFHEDDLDDCGWETDVVIETDNTWRTGIYAVRLYAGDVFDYVPFYVRPANGESHASVLVLAPTNTYLAYGNEQLINAVWDDPNFVEKSTDAEIVVRPLDQYLLDHPELGASIYDRHPDGSGICFSSRLRPLLTMRPQFRMWMHNQARHFSADLYLIEWLETNGIEYDVATDEDLQVTGDALFDGYRVVLTGGHPEYWTFTMLESLERYLEQGGKLMYLGGNGFYWVTAMDGDEPHFIEVRRGVSGIRAWTSHPGEVTLATSGEPGGLWRHRGKTPNSLCGIGFAAEGWGGAPGYVRTEQSLDPRAAFIFAGIAPDEIIGDFGFVMGGAAGDEIDRVDHALGTPVETLRLATTELRHSDYYQLVVEDCAFVLPGLGGTEEPRVRSDIVYLEDSGGGAVFSTGSINWIGSLMWNGGDNNVSTMTRNVLRAFAELP